jgi:hypothetical protein
MKKKVLKPNPAPPLLCWDICSQFLYGKMGLLSNDEPKPMQTNSIKSKKKQL